MRRQLELKDVASCVWFGKSTGIASLMLLFGFTQPIYVCMCVYSNMCDS